MQNGVLNAANVLVHWHPVVGTLADHGLIVFRIAVAHVVPRRINKGVHGVGLAATRLAAHRAHNAGVKPFVFCQRVARPIGHAILRQHHGQIFFRHRHCAMLRAMNDGDWRSPVALAADAPIAQAPGDFFLAQAFGGKVGSHGLDTRFKAQTIVFFRINSNAQLFVAIPVCPSLVAVRLPFDVSDLLDQ